MDVKDIEKSTNPEIKLAYEGKALECFTQKNFLVSSDASGIGRWKFEIVPKSNGGKGSLIFFMKMPQMMLLCDEIISGVFFRNLSDNLMDKNAPYTYVTGESGHLSLKFRKSKSPNMTVVQIYNGQKKTNMMIPVPSAELIVMAKKFQIYCGLRPVNENSVYGRLHEAFELGIDTRANFYKKAQNDEDLRDYIPAEEEAVAEDSDKQEQTPPPAQPKKETPATNNEPAKTENNIQKFRLIVYGEKVLKKGLYFFKAVDEHNNPLELLFRKEQADKLDWFPTFENKAREERTQIQCMGEKRNNRVLFVSPVKK